MSATAMAWIVSLFFVLVLVAGFLIGMWRGLKHSTVNVVVSVVGIVIAFFITPPITNAILGINIPYEGSNIPLSDLALEMAKGETNLNLIISSNPNMAVIFANLPKAIINALLFIVVTAIIEGIFYIVYKIFAKTVFKYVPGANRKRVLGGVVGVVKTFILTLIVLMPFSGMLGMVSSMSSTTDVFVADAAGSAQEQQTDLIDKIIPKSIMDIIKGVDNSALFAPCGVFDMDGAMFDYYANIEVDGQTVQLRKEITSAYNVANTTNKLISAFQNEGNFASINFDYLDSQIDGLLNGALFQNVIAHTLGEMLANYKDYTFINNLSFVSENQDIVNALSDGIKASYNEKGNYYEYLITDLKTIYQIFKNISESGMIDEIIGLDEPTIKSIMSILASHSTNIETVISQLFTINIVQDIAEPTIEKYDTAILSSLTPDEEIEINTSNWQDADWADVATNLGHALDGFADMATILELNDAFLSAPIKSLMSTAPKYDLPALTNALGRMIDALRTNKLLKNSDGKSILDSKLSSLQLLFEGQEVDNNGTLKTLSNYVDLMGYIEPSLTLLRDSGLYSELTKTGATSTSILKAIASSIKTDANVLNKIILPLYQVNVTKSFIQEAVGAMQSDLVNFNTLSTYEDWKYDLNKISSLLKTLDSKTVASEPTKTYLDLVLEGRTDILVYSMLPTEVADIFKPILYAQSTSGIRATILDTIRDKLREITGDNSVALSQAILVEKADEDQAEEFCAIVAKLIQFEGEFKGLDKTLIGETLELMKTNAYRTTLNQKADEGIFSSAFTAIMTKFKDEFATEISGLQVLVAKDDTKAEEYYDKLTNNKFDEINYIEMMEYFTNLQLPEET